MPSCDQTGVPIHFHSSTASGSASLMSLRILPRVAPRQSPSSAILFEMSSDAGWPWLATGFFMASRGGDGAPEAQRVGDAAERLEGGARAAHGDVAEIQHPAEHALVDIDALDLG